MAKNREKDEQTNVEQATGQATAANSELAVSGQVAEQVLQEPTQSEPALPEPAKTAPENTEAPALESLHVLADRYRVPTWRQAALERMMGWAKGKVVSEHEYRAALAALGNRRMGGGRTE